MNSLVPGSVGAVAKATGRTLAETLMDVDTIVLVDTSGSMGAGDSRGGRTRYDVACDELAKLQAAQPGRLGVISFSTYAMFCPTGVPENISGSTDLTQGLHLAKTMDVGGVRFIVVSDGYPDDPQEALLEAAKFTGTISTIYVGPENETSGRQFLERLANLHRGQAVTADRAKELAAAVTLLLEAK